MADRITHFTYSEIIPFTPDDLPKGLTRASTATYARPLLGQWQSLDTSGMGSSHSVESVRYDFLPDGRFFSELVTTLGEKHSAEGAIFADATTLWLTVSGQARAAKLPYSLVEGVLTIGDDEPDSCLVLKRVPSPHP